jgi:hypothetical protein
MCKIVDTDDFTVVSTAGGATILLCNRAHKAVGLAF